jgi:uncharacterized membrane protein YfcA
MVSAAMVSLIGLKFGLENFHAGVCGALAIGGFGGSFLGASLKRKISFERINLALVAAYWTAGAFLLLRLGHN